MIALVSLLLLGGVVFVEQPLDGVETRYTPGWSARTNTLCADLDGDGVNDIITPTTVAFQRNGGFPKAQQTPLPRFASVAYADVWKNEIYILLRDRLEVLRWSSSDWQCTLSQPIAWGSAVTEASFPVKSPPVVSNTVSFDDFLCDVNADDSPEIVRVAFDGIHIYSKKDLFYEEAAVWQIVPPLTARISRGALWPPDARRIEIPDLMRKATVKVEKDGAWIQYDIPAGDRRVFYRRDFYAFDASRGLSLASAPDRSIESNTIDSRYRCADMNQDDVLDLVHDYYSGETAPPLSMPIIECSVSTDGGKSFYSAKSLGAEPRRIATDFNQDGRLDIISENKRLVEGGIRETLVRGLTRREVGLEVEVRLQDESGAFPTRPSFSHTFTITLDKPPAYQSTMFGNFLDGRLFSLDGDYDGDGFLDAAIQDRPDRIAIRKGTPKGISSGLLATLPISSNGEFESMDIDGDGRSDFVLSAGGEITFYLSRDPAP